MDVPAILPLTPIAWPAKLTFAIVVGLWVAALVSYVIAWLNYNAPADANKQKTYNFWMTLGSTLVWVQLYFVLALVGVPKLF